MAGEAVPKWDGGVERMELVMEGLVWGVLVGVVVALFRATE